MFEDSVEVRETLETVTLKKIVTITTRYERVGAPPAEEEPPPEGETVLEWDESALTILKEGEAGPATAPQEGNNAGASTRIVDFEGEKVLEFSINHDEGQRAEGTGARLFIRDWGWAKPLMYQRVSIQYEVFLPQPITLDTGVKDPFLGLGVQTKHGGGVIWALDVENVGNTLSPWLWHYMARKVVHPDAPAAYRVGAWNSVRVDMLLTDKADGWLIHRLNGQALWTVPGATAVASGAAIGLALYSNAVHGTVKALFRNFRVLRLP